MDYEDLKKFKSDLEAEVKNLENDKKRLSRSRSSRSQILAVDDKIEYVNILIGKVQNILDDFERIDSRMTRIDRQSRALTRGYSSDKEKEQAIESLNKERETLKKERKDLQTKILTYAANSSRHTELNGTIRDLVFKNKKGTQKTKDGRIKTTTKDDLWEWYSRNTQRRYDRPWAAIGRGLGIAVASFFVAAIISGPLGLATLGTIVGFGGMGIGLWAAGRTVVSMVARKFGKRPNLNREANPYEGDSNDREQTKQYEITLEKNFNNALRNVLSQNKELLNDRGIVNGNTSKVKSSDDIRHIVSLIRGVDRDFRRALDSRGIFNSRSFDNRQFNACQGEIDALNREELNILASDEMVSSSEKYKDLLNRFNSIKRVYEVDTLISNMERDFNNAKDAHGTIDASRINDASLLKCLNAIKKMSSEELEYISNDRLNMVYSNRNIYNAVTSLNKLRTSGNINSVNECVGIVESLTSEELAFVPRSLLNNLRTIRTNMNVASFDSMMDAIMGRAAGTFLSAVRGAGDLDLSSNIPWIVATKKASHSYDELRKLGEERRLDRTKVSVLEQIKRKLGTDYQRKLEDNTPSNIRISTTSTTVNVTFSNSSRELGKQVYSLSSNPRLREEAGLQSLADRCADFYEIDDVEIVGMTKGSSRR